MATSFSAEFVNAHIGPMNTFYMATSTTLHDDWVGGVHVTMKDTPQLKLGFCLEPLAFYRVPSGLVADDIRKHLTFYPRHLGGENLQLRGSARKRNAVGKFTTTAVHIFLKGCTEMLRTSDDKPMQLTIYAGNFHARSADDPQLTEVGKASFLKPGDDQKEWFLPFVQAYHNEIAPRTLRALRIYARLDPGTSRTPFVTRSNVDPRPADASGTGTDDYIVYLGNRISTLEQMDTPQLGGATNRNEKARDCDVDDFDEIEKPRVYQVDEESNARIQALQAMVWPEENKDDDIHNPLFNGVRAIANASDLFPVSEASIEFGIVFSMIAPIFRTMILCMDTPENVSDYEAGLVGRSKLLTASRNLVTVAASLVAKTISYLAHVAKVRVPTRRKSLDGKPFFGPMRQKDVWGRALRQFRDVQWGDFHDENKLVEKIREMFAHADNFQDHVVLRATYGLPPYGKPTYPVVYQRPTQCGSPGFVRPLQYLLEPVCS